MFRKTLTLILLLAGTAVICPSAAQADSLPSDLPPETRTESEPEPSPSPIPKETPIPAQNVPFFTYFPLTVPFYAMKGATYPVELLIRQIEKKPKILGAVEFLSNSKKSYSIYPLITVGDGMKFGGGAGLSHLNMFHESYQLNAYFILYQDLDIQTKLTFANPAAFYVKNKAFSFEFGAAYRKDSDKDFYGIGPASQESDKSDYSYDHTEVGAWFGFELLPHLTLGPFLVFDMQSAGSGKGSKTPSVQETFPPSEIPGFGRNIQYLDVGFRLQHDTRDPIVSHQRGGLQELLFHRYQGLNTTDFDYFQINVDIEQYFSLGKPRWVVLLHNMWIFQASTGADTVPFFRMAALDVNHWLRGFDGGRFRDLAAVTLNAELHFPLWDNIDGILLADTGKVFNGIKDFNFDDFRYSVGVGARIIVNRYYMFRLEAAYGGEGMNVHFKAVQAF